LCSAGAPLSSQQQKKQRAPLGASDLVVSNVALGTMTMGEQTDEAEAHRMLSLSADAGINFVDVRVV
jgi:aryl-alcohol dehydrogenase-like predicted oxidoreductase